MPFGKYVSVLVGVMVVFANFAAEEGIARISAIF